MYNSSNANDKNQIDCLKILENYIKFIVVAVYIPTKKRNRL